MGWGGESEGRRGLWDLGERGQIRHEMATLQLHVAGWHIAGVAMATDTSCSRNMSSGIKTTSSFGDKSNSM